MEKVIVNKIEYKGAIAREIKEALEHNSVKENGCFYLKKWGPKMGFDTYPRLTEHLFLKKISGGIHFFRCIDGVWQEMTEETEEEYQYNLIK